MPEVFAMIADGSEEVECLAVVDILRRAGITTQIVSIDQKVITSSHNVKIIADAVIGDVDLSSAEVLFLTGGIPGTERLSNCEKLVAALKRAAKENKRIAAICAAPALVLGANGLLVGKRAVCYPDYADKLLGATVQKDARVVTDGNITTARGLGCAIELGLELVKLLRGESKAKELAIKIQM